MFPWTQRNDYFVFGRNECAAVGGGAGFALWLDEELARGNSARSDTFGNDPLSSEHEFDVACVELWTFEWRVDVSGFGVTSFFNASFDKLLVTSERISSLSVTRPQPSAQTRATPKARLLDVTRQAAEDVPLIAAGTGKRDLGCAAPATRACRSRLFSPDADLVVEPEVLLLCPITRTMFRDPVVVVDSGHTYERIAVLSHFDRNGAKDPLTGRALSSTKVTTNRTVRQFVQAWLDRHPGVTPDGWDSRELLEPSEDDGTRLFDGENDVECSGHGVRCALNCRGGGQRIATGALERGDDGKQPGGGARVGRVWPDRSGAG